MERRGGIRLVVAKTNDLQLVPSEVQDIMELEVLACLTVFHDLADLRNGAIPGMKAVCRTYRADRKDCRVCPMLHRCVSDSHRSRSVRMNIFEEAVKKQRKMDGTPTHKHILDLRQIWCEGSFAAQKWMHNLRRLFRRGIEAAEEHCLLSATALNLKRMVRCLG